MNPIASCDNVRGNLDLQRLLFFGRPYANLRPGLTYMKWTINLNVDCRVPTILYKLNASQTLSKIEVEKIDGANQRTSTRT